MDEETLAMFQQYLANQDAYLKQMSEDISQIRQMQEQLRSDIDAYHVEKEAQDKADAELAEKEAAVEAAEKAAYQEFIDGVKEII